MTDRRRNIFVLLLVVRAARSGRSSSSRRSRRASASTSRAASSLIYQAKPTKQSTVNSDAINRTIDIMRERVDQLGVSEPEIQRSGPDQIDVALPNVKNADEAAQAGRHDRPAVLLRLGDERPRRQLQAGAGGRERHGRPVGGHRRRGDRLLHRGHARRASAPSATSRAARRNGLFYLVDTKTKKVLAGPDETRRDLAQEAQNKGIKPGPDQKVVEVKPGTIVVRAAVAERQAEERSVLRPPRQRRR